MGTKTSVDTDAATVSLGTIVIDAPPDKVYTKLARARDWEGWLRVVHLIHTAQPNRLETDNTFSYTGRLAPGFIDAIVQDAEPNKVLNWNETALFGLIRGGSRWQLQRQGGRAQGIWMRKPKTIVTLDQEVTGPLSFLVSNLRLDKHTDQWLTELKVACEKGIGDDLHKERQEDQ